ncbi:MAG: GMC family oxidoreductase [Rhodoluna sp.]|nr:GMC family oxidoreductase [Rhodoluna sp.]
MHDYDVVIIGSGFGGSVAALRLTEKGYKVCVLEAGARFADNQFAKNSWELKKFLFFPRIGLKGIQRIDLLRNVMVMSGAGVGGGSLVYANTLYRPPTSFYETGSWAGIADWQSLLEPYFTQAEKMLGVVVNPFFSPSDDALKRLAERNGKGDTFRLTPVGVHFGEAGKTIKDPFFGGKGPDRTGCINCGECMTGCRHGAKNTLVKNYLYLAESAGAEVRELTTVTDIIDAADGFTIKTRGTSGGKKQSITAKQVVVAAGALGTAKLLQRVKAKGNLQGLSPMLGQLSRTNSESLLGVVSRDDTVDYSQGSAITSSYFPDEHTHIESVRYGKGSNFMALMESFMSSGKKGQAPNFGLLLWTTLKNLHRLPKFYNLRHWSERTLILLVMQSADNSLSTFLKRGLFGKTLSSRQGTGKPNPAWVKVGHEAARDLAKDMNGTPGAVITEPFGIPMTAHFLGGCVIADNPENGVVDPFLRAFGVPGLHIFDGSTLSANPGVNPSLSITAQAEWACAHWPNKGEGDARPGLGFRFAPIKATAPKSPLVPASAPAALRIPLSPL